MKDNNRIMAGNSENIKLLYIDLFCGAGGTSTGVNSARLNGERCAEVIACVNHDANAIASHAANHPDALHFTEDIRTLELSPLVAHVESKRDEYPDAKVVLWASLECTNFSKAKGGQPRDPDSRTLAEHLFRYIEAVDPDYVQIENVEEFMSWGDVDEKGRPVSMDKGRKYMRWVNKVKRYGYDFDYRILNAADYGAYTSRKRYFGIFAKKGLPIAWPEQTHVKRTIKGGMFASLPQWRGVKDVLNFNDVGKSIFGRKRPLADATLKRIYAGLIKFVAGGKEAFLLKYNSMSKKGVYHAPSIDDPCPTVAVQGRLGLVQAFFVSKQFSGHPESKNTSIEEPAGTITTIDHHALVSVCYGHGYCRSVDEPAPTLTTKDRLELVQLSFVDMQYGNGTPSSIDDPAPTVTATPKHKLVSCIPAYDCADLAAFPHLVKTDTGMLAIVIESTDSPIMRKIKEFMAMYGVFEIKMRMFRIHELKKIMGFSDNYKLVGTQEEQKKYIGNAVEVTLACAWCVSLCAAIAMASGKHKQCVAA